MQKGGERMTENTGFIKLDRNMLRWRWISTPNTAYLFVLLLLKANYKDMDFQGVKFATRSFIDEFYNLFLKTPEANTFRVELNNVPSDIKAMLDAVSRTQVRAKVIPSQSQEVSFKNVKEFLNYFSTLVL